MDIKRRRRRRRRRRSGCYWLGECGGDLISSIVVAAVVVAVVAVHASSLSTYASYSRATLSIHQSRSVRCATAAASLRGILLDSCCAQSHFISSDSSGVVARDSLANEINTQKKKKKKRRRWQLYSSVQHPSLSLSGTRVNQQHHVWHSSLTVRSVRGPLIKSLAAVTVVCVAAYHETNATKIGSPLVVR